MGEREPRQEQEHAEGSVMAEITRAVRNTFGVMADLVPAEIRKQISQDEFVDRLSYARELSTRSQHAIDPVARRSYATRARAAIEAPPRDEIQYEYASRIAKAAGLPPGSQQAAVIKADAQAYLDAHPVAPRRNGSAAIIAKAKAERPDFGDDELMVCYDQQGRPFGVCRVADLTPVVTDPAAVRKAAAAGKARRAAPGPKRAPGQR